jgi:hypothetical protein
MLSRVILSCIPLMWCASSIVNAGTIATIDPPPPLDFKCCNGADFPVDDLEVTFSEDQISVAIPFDPAFPCAGTPVGMVAEVKCPGTIPVGYVIELQDYDGNYVSACWTGDTCITPASPIPEPNTLSLLWIGLFGLGLCALRRQFHLVGGSDSLHENGRHGSGQFPFGPVNGNRGQGGAETTIAR